MRKSQVTANEQKLEKNLEKNSQSARWERVSAHLGLDPQGLKKEGSAHLGFDPQDRNMPPHI
jgi:hypothetical protein